MIFIVLVLFFLTVSPLYGQVLFETNFDNTETWQPRNGANDTAPDGSQITPCDVGVSGCPSPPPGGWDYYYINGWWAGPNYHDSVRISDTVGDAPGDTGGTAAGMGGTGKAFVKWEESHSQNGAFSSDGTLTKLLDTDEKEVYARIFIKYKPGFELSNTEVYSDKIFRVLHWDRGSPTLYQYFSGGYSAPIYVYNSYNSPAYGWRHNQSFRCDPQETDYYCQNNGTIASGGNAQYAGAPSFSAHMGNGDWHQLDFRIKMNTYVGGGVWNSDGIIEYSYDGTLVYQQTTMRWVQSGTDGEIGWNIVDIGGNTQNLFADNAVMGQTYHPGDTIKYGGYNWTCLTELVFSLDNDPGLNTDSKWRKDSIISDEPIEQWYALDNIVVSTTPIPADYVIGGATNGTCGTSNNQYLSSIPTTNLCATGTVSSVSGSGPWSWTCVGSNGGTTASCSASLATSGYKWTAKGLISCAGCK